MSTQVVNWEKLREYCKSIFVSLGVSDDDAFTIADCLVEADLCGHESHGVTRMITYTKRVEVGIVNKKFEMKVLQEHPASIAFDACNSPGMPSGKFAMERCIEKARLAGACVATVCNSNHYGMAQYYVKDCKDIIGISMTNAPPNIAPYGSIKAYVGTNPIAIAVPTHGNPLLLDMAPSVVAKGKIQIAAKVGRDIPEGWALTKEGLPTTNSKEAVEGTLLPIGGYSAWKGSGLSIMVDILTGVLSGAQFGPYLGNLFNNFETPQNIGHFFIAIDISKFTDLENFKTRVEKMSSDIKALPKVPGIEEIYMPGDLEQIRKAKKKAEGMELPTVVYNELREMGERYKVPIII